MKKILLVFSTLMLYAMSSLAQEAIFNRNDLTSPEVNADGTVTFRLYAPKAITVEVQGDFLQNGKASMTEENGLWTYTSESLAPELYSYHFVVNGTDLLDPSNVYHSRDITTYNNLFIVTRAKGDAGDLYSVNEVPHGDVHKVWYDSPTLGMKRRMTVYTPAGYDYNNSKRRQNGIRSISHEMIDMCVQCCCTIY